ncbi:MAG: DUF1611 domain-containing protein [Fimbriimonadaceae bacterium]|nr:DUF1611 domain-containing protein [Fimbriimonadaceae bacterium]QYK58394.1 MAG: DUF1611 domain-containing protein [Fimbriimonadaceae bacterium]
MLRPDQPMALFMAGAFEENTGKMGLGVLRYSPNPVVAVVDPCHAGQRVHDLTRVGRDAPIVATIEDAKGLGAKALVLGIAPLGGRVPEAWLPALDRAAELGLSLVNGLHDHLASRYPQLEPDQFVWDIRTEPPGLGSGHGLARSLDNRRLLMVGTDMSVGKMTAGLEIELAARHRGLGSAFVATGQTGITIMGSGVPLDAVRLDYASGAVEREVLRHADRRLVVIEGQGSLLNPASSATLPLMRGSCPTHLVLCHRAGMASLKNFPSIHVPALASVVRLYEDVAEALGSFDRPKTVGVALNTFYLSDDEALEAVQNTEGETGLPCCDPVRHGADRLLDAVLAD